ncbi:hypothetical protein RAA17_20225 [Komagataeibacter rhaeticus]|nr:hypothetical protein [Komagataeibacter rhaeticus]
MAWRVMMEPILLAARMQAALLAACHMALVLLTTPLWIGLLRWMATVMEGERRPRTLPRTGGRCGGHGGSRACARRRARM